MSIDRDEAISWSVDRIKIELEFLYKELDRLREDERDYLDWFEKEYIDPLKTCHHDPNAYLRSISAVESDIEFLKMLLRKKVC